MFGEPEGYVPSATERDMRERWMLGADMIEAAQRALANASADSIAVVGMALVNKRRSFWTTDVEVITCPSIYVTSNSGSGDGRNVETCAERDAFRELRRRGADGTTSRAVVWSDGECAVWEGIASVVDGRARGPVAITGEHPTCLYCDLAWPDPAGRCAYRTTAEGVNVHYVW